MVFWFPENPIERLGKKKHFTIKGEYNVYKLP
jgi:hypothetical protein